MTYRVTEYDEMADGRPSFLVESDSGNPLEPALFVVSERNGLWSTFLSPDGTRCDHPPRRRDAVNAARRRLRELETSGHYR